VSSLPWAAAIACCNRSTVTRRAAHNGRAINPANKKSASLRIVPPSRRGAANSPGVLDNLRPQARFVAIEKRCRRNIQPFDTGILLRLGDLFHAQADAENAHRG
jgi:hypothetical protein